MQIMWATPKSMASNQMASLCCHRSQASIFSVFQNTGMSKSASNLDLNIIHLFAGRVHENMKENPKMRFLTKIVMNDEVVSKGFGPNKKVAKTAAADILL